MNLGKLKLAGANNVPTSTAVPGTAAAPVESAPAVPAVAAKPAGLKLGGLRLGAKPAESVAGAGPVSTGTDIAVRESIPDVSGEEENQPLNSPEGFQAMLDRLDALIVAGQGVTTLTLDTSRKYVASIYKELKANPHLDPIFKDRDMHNVMAVVQRSTFQAKEVIQQKKVKAEASAKKKSLVNTQFGDMDFGMGFGDSSPNQTASTVAVAKAMQGQDLMGFGDINTDDIAAQIQAARGAKKK